MGIDDNFYLSLALNEAWKYQGLTYPNPAVGCVIVDKNGVLLSVEAHEKAGACHAELRAVKSALKKLNPNFIFPEEPNVLYNFILQNHNDLLKNAHVFVTLEPCSHQGKTPPCALLLKALHVKRVVIGTYDINSEASGGAKILQNAHIETICHHALQKECEMLLDPFRLWQQGSFSFFKLALSLNGVFDGGVITCKESRVLVHQLRDRCDLLVIGGNTVRFDKPILDARLIQGHAPDVLIYSKKQSFEQDTPLFSVPNRAVHVSDKLDLARRYNLIMYEGAQGLLQSVKQKVDWFLIFRSPNLKQGKTIQIDQSLTLIWQGKIGTDEYGWYKRA